MSSSTPPAPKPPGIEDISDLENDVTNPVVRRLLKAAQEAGDDVTLPTVFDTRFDDDTTVSDEDLVPGPAAPDTGNGNGGPDGDDDPTLITLTHDPDETARPAAPVAATTARDGPQSGPAPAPSAPRQGEPDRATGGGILRGFVLDLVERGILNERKAVSIAMQVRDSGQSFMRIVARDHTLNDAASVVRAVGERLGVAPIEKKADLFDRLGHEDWLTPQLAEKWLVLPLGREDGRLLLAAVDPFDVLTADWAGRHAGMPCRLVPIVPDLFWDGLGRYRTQDLDAPANPTLIVPVDIDWSSRTAARPDIGNWDIPVVVDFILHRSIEANASDVHIEPTDDSLIVRYRIDGMLHEEHRLPGKMHAPVSSRIKVLSNLDVAERRRPQDGRISVLVRDRPIDIRVSTLPTVNGEKVVMRLLDDSALRPRPEQLGLSDRDLRLLLDKSSAPYGMIMLSGPTGSGKTTTLYSCLSAIDRMTRNVVTIEDPVEYRLKGVHQMQVNDSIGLNFATGLRTILRQDPDVIMVGECRDDETARLAVQASLTGHLVLSTIHANDAVGVVSRLLDLKVDPFLIANSVSLSIAQRLVRLNCESCLDVIDGADLIVALRAEGITIERLERLGLTIDPHLPCPVSNGCQRCRYTGYNGRQAVFEMFSMTDEAKACLMQEPFDSGAFKQIVRHQGMQSMIENAQGLIDEGRTSYSELVRVLGEH